GVIFVRAPAGELERERRRAAFCDMASRLHETKFLLPEVSSKTIWREATDVPRGEPNLAEAANRSRRCPCIAWLGGGIARRLRELLKMLADDFFGGARLADVAEGEEQRICDEAVHDGEKSHGSFLSGALQNDGVEFFDAANDFRHSAKDAG